MRRPTIPVKPLDAIRRIKDEVCSDCGKSAKGVLFYTGLPTYHCRTCFEKHHYAAYVKPGGGV